MARFLKNPDLSPNSTAARLPIVPSSAYGDSATSGLIRFNESNNRIEFFYSGAWNQIAKVGSVPLVVDEFTGDGSTTGPFLMTQSELNDSDILVTIGGVYQQPTTHYYVVGYQIWFTSPPPAPGINPNKIVVVHNINSTNAT